jgi:polyamine oxidase
MHEYLTRRHAATYDTSGAVDYMNVVKNEMDAYDEFLVAAGARIPNNLFDLTARAGLSLIGQKPKTPHELAAEYFVFDFTDAQTPEQTSFMASAWVRLACYPEMTCR